MEKKFNDCHTKNDNNLKKYKLNYDNYEYIILLKIENNKIVIICQNTTKLENFCYKNSYSFEEIKKLNYLFLCFPSLEDILNIFDELLKKKKLQLKKKMKILFYW